MQRAVRESHEVVKHSREAGICSMVSSGGEVMFSKLCSPNQVMRGCRTQCLSTAEMNSQILAKKQLWTISTVGVVPARNTSLDHQTFTAKIEASMEQN